MNKNLLILKVIMKQYCLLSLVLCIGIAQGASDSQSRSSRHKKYLIAKVPAFLALKNARPFLTSTYGNVYFAKYCNQCQSLQPSDCEKCNAISRQNFNATYHLDSVRTETTYQFNQSCSQHNWRYRCSACRAKTTKKKPKQ